MNERPAPIVLDADVEPVVNSRVAEALARLVRDLWDKGLLDAKKDGREAA